MKKAYSKPDIFFESFKLSSSIANTCEGLKGNSGDSENCEVDISDGGISITLFAVGVNKDCESVECYHVSSSTTDIFGS